MRRFLKPILILLLTCGLAAAQSSTTAKAADKPPSAPAVNLPFGSHRGFVYAADIWV